MKKSLFFIFSVLAMVSARGQVQYHVADVQVMYDVMRRMPNLTGEFLFRNGHSAFSADINVYPRKHEYHDRLRSNFEAKIGYTWFFRKAMKGWGIHAGWDGAYYQSDTVPGYSSAEIRRYNYELEDNYLIGPEYMYSNSRGTTLDFKFLVGYANYDGCPLVDVKFSWDVPRLFGLEGLSFMGKYEAIVGPERYYYPDHKGTIYASRAEIVFFYNTASLFDGRCVGHYLGRDGLGVFLKLRYTSLHPSGWPSGVDYYDNYLGTLTPCIGLRYDF